MDGFVTGMTEAKEAERYRSQYELLARYANDVVGFFEPQDGRILEANDAAVRIYGYSHAELRAMSIRQLRAPEAPGTLAAELAAASIEEMLFETVHVRKDGGRVPVEVSAGPALLDGRRVVVAIIRDISARRRVEGERAQNERLRELTVGILGHDLRSPLFSVLMGTSLLIRRGTLEEADVRTLLRVQQSALRMGRMIDQLLDLTHARLGGGIPVRPARVDLGEVVGHVVDELRAAKPAATIEVRCEGDVSGEWDADRLAQVFSNIVHNAVEHGDGTLVDVVLFGGEGNVATRVHNGGEPIHPEFLSTVFDPFRRTERKGSRQERGLGLGLYIAQQIVLAHGGRIRVTSAAGEGTTFEVELPRRLPAPQTPRRTAGDTLIAG